MDKLAEWIKLSCVAIEPVGSRIICEPPPKTACQDWMCLLLPTMNRSAFYDELRDDGWHDSAIPYQGWNGTFVKEQDMLMICQDEAYFKKFMEVTALAKEKNILKKMDRTRFFKEELSSKKFPNKKLYSPKLLIQDDVGDAQGVNGAVPQWQAAPLQFYWNEGLQAAVPVNPAQLPEPDF